VHGWLGHWLGPVTRWLGPAQPYGPGWAQPLQKKISSKNISKKYVIFRKYFTVF